jgi:hypothetical protein
MHTKRIFLVSVLCSFIAAINASETDSPQKPTYAAASLDAALQRGSSDPAIPFQLQVNCIDQKGIRSMQLFSGGATIWNRRTQIMLSARVRSELVETLISHRFSSLDDRYGGSERRKRTEAPAKMTCRIHAEIEGFKKSSVQQAGGEQSAQLAALATALLDQVEKHAVSGVTPDSLQDALEKLDSGQLPPQVLQLRFVHLAEKGGNTTGSIMQIRGGELSHQDYSPGNSVTSQVWNQLDPDHYPGLLAELQSTQLESLPGNLWSQNHVEIEIRVLGHKKVVIAKPFTRLKKGEQETAQQRFDALVRFLKNLN